MPLAVAIVVEEDLILFPSLSLSLSSPVFLLFFLGDNFFA